MSYSYQPHTTNASQATYTFSFAGIDPGYISTEHLVVEVRASGQSEFTTLDNARWYISGTNQITLTPTIAAPADGKNNLRIRRVVPKDVPYASFPRGSMIDMRNLDRSFIQMLEAFQEFLDGFLPVGFYFQQNINMNGHKFTNLGPGTQSGDSVNWDQWDNHEKRIVALETDLTELSSRTIPFYYIATGGETRWGNLPLKFSTAIMFINGVFQNQNLGAFSISDSGFNFAEPLVKGDEVYVLLGSSLAGPDDYVTFNDLEDSLSWERAKPTSAVNSFASLGNVSVVSIWEERFTSLITNKPNPLDYQTWDWSPAIQAAINYCISYSKQTAVNGDMYGGKTLYIPSGVYPVKSGLMVTKYMSSTGSLATICNIIGDGMTASIIQSATEGMTTLKATSCKINLSNLGFRAGADYCTAWELGDKSTWSPVVHSRWESVGASGFAKGLVSNLTFDSTFIDVFVQNITKANAGDTAVSSGIEIALYEGLGNGGSAGDSSNQIMFIRPTVETAVSDNCILLNVVGKNSSYAHHAFTCTAGHFETHNLKAKCFNFKNLFNANFVGTVFSQNGATVDSMYRLGWFENCWNVNMMGCRMVTTNRLASVSSTDIKMIKVIGSGQNLTFPGTHFIGPYNDINASKHNLDQCIDYSEASKLKRAFDPKGCTVGDYTSRALYTMMRVCSLSGVHDFYYDVDETTGAMGLYYSTNITDGVAGTKLLSMSPTGSLDTGGDINLGTLVAAATRYIGTSTGRISFDTLGRIYLRSVSSAQEWVMGSVSFNPTTDNTFTLGTASLRPSAVYSVKYMYTSTVGDWCGAGSPEGTVSAGIGSTYRRSDGGAGTSFYVKESGTGSTGWVAK